MHTADKIDMRALREIPIIQGLSDDARDQLLRGSHIRVYERGETIFMQGDAADAFFIVLDGWIKVYRMTSSGEEAVVGVFTRGQSFAEAAAFSGGVFPATSEAVTECRIIRISAAHLSQTIASNPQIGLTMLASTSKHLHELVCQIEALKAHTGAQRVAEFLVSLTSVDDGDCTLILPYDKALIAGRLGMKPESLSRAFQKLKSYGVRIQQNKASISDIDILRDFIEQERSVVMHQGR
ncbi:Crp/Fnr family transcriptional regulator [Coralliovum pocilloporae]|uniref:Crp/Fnr family transcriptional regulator n=1 Tax=Coralliovum pocilloporae TaxID=3066369 RepID=UPI0033072675